MSTENAAAAASPAPTPKGRVINPVLKLALEFGPLALFFIASARTNLIVATSVLMAGVVVTLAVSYALTRRLPTMPLVTAVAVLVFGALTLYFDNPIFIKVKPTIVNVIFGTALLGGLCFDKPLLPVVLDVALHLDREGWSTQTDTFWAGFKVFGTMPITVLFALSQVPLILRHEVKEPAEAPATTDEF